MMRPVYLFLLVIGLAGGAPAGTAPPGLERWGEESYTLQPGEAASFQVDFDQIPVRRWVLLVESDERPVHLNVRRVRDGSLVYDQRDETRHEADIPWGKGERLSAVLAAGRGGGVFAVSIWGPPRGRYPLSYAYDVNRALESLTAGDLAGARRLLLTALDDDPQDAVASVLLRGLDAGVRPSRAPAAGTAVPTTRDPEAVRERVRTTRERAASLRAGGRHFAAIEALQLEISWVETPELRADLLGDLAHVLLDLGNRSQAREAVAAAREAGLSAERLDDLEARFEDEPD